MALHDRDKHIATSILLIWQQFYAVQNEEIFSHVVLLSISKSTAHRWQK